MAETGKGLIMINNYDVALKYLRKKNIQKHISALAKKYKDKNVLIYGAGLFFDVIKENFDISRLNIVAISDMKFKEVTQYNGIKAIPPLAVKDLNFDAMIVSNYAVRKIKKSVKSELFPVCGKFKIEHFNKNNNKDYLIILLEILKEKFGSKVIKKSKLANKYLKGLSGIEIGGSACNSFGLKTLNVDYTNDMETIFKKEEKRLVGKALKVDVVASGDELPFKDNKWDFVVSSHVLEHVWNPIKGLQEWMRVIKPGGYIFMIVPHKERTFDRDRERTALKELIERHEDLLPDPKTHAHHSVWITDDLLELCEYLKFNVVEYQNVDDKAGNGFTVVIQKPCKN